jgi:site-specific recombinase XerD
MRSHTTDSRETPTQRTYAGAPGDTWPQAFNESSAGLTLKKPSAQDLGTTFEAFVEMNFIPQHVERKSFAGRTHYRSILKHILRPETVDRLFKESLAEVRTRLKAVPDWPYLDGIKLCELTGHHVRELVDAAASQGYSTQTVKHIRNVLGMIISYAKRQGFFTGDNPVFSVNLPPLPRKRPHALTIVQAKEMLGMMQSPEREIALITMTTGLSISEICGLQWKNVNLSKLPLHCDGDLIPPVSILVKQHWSPEGIVNLSPKRIRVIDVSEALSYTLLLLRREPISSNLNSYVFVTPSGRPLCPASVRARRLEPIGRKMQMPWISWPVLTRAHMALLSESKRQLRKELDSSIR